MKIFVVEIQDFSHLGGPMGSEYVSTIGTKTFSSYELAVKFIYKDAKKRFKLPLKNYLKDRYKFDFGGTVGYSIEEQTVDQ